DLEHAVARLGVEAPRGEAAQVRGETKQPVEQTDQAGYAIVTPRDERAFTIHPLVGHAFAPKRSRLYHACRSRCTRCRCSSPRPSARSLSISQRWRRHMVCDRWHRVAQIHWRTCEHLQLSANLIDGCAALRVCGAYNKDAALMTTMRCCDIRVTVTSASPDWRSQVATPRDISKSR